jgi:uncharacterized protein YuzE
MAFQVVERFDFEKVQYSYDPKADVLYLSFGPPAAAVAIQVEDWLAFRLSSQPPFLVGMTIVGYKRIFERINQYIEQELPKRIEALSRVFVNISYSDDTDTLVMRFEEQERGLRKWLKRLWRTPKAKPSIFEPFVANVYVEKSLPSKDIVGLKILDYTKSGQTAAKAFFEKTIDTVFEPHPEDDENAHLVTNALIGWLDWKKLATLAA